MPAFTENDWSRLLCEMGVAPLTADRWAGAFCSEAQPENFSAGMDDILDWCPQILHESGMLERTEEVLSYKTPERLCKIWPTRFQSIESALPFVRNPKALAIKVYGDRMGNRPGTEDGHTYRGRSPIMLTGLDGYVYVGDLMGQDLVTLPHLIEGPIYGINAAVAWWEGRVPDAFLGDQVKLRRRVNGGTIGLDHCLQLAELARQVFA